MGFDMRIKQLRKSKNITQLQLADTLHLNRAAIASYETSGREPNFETLIKMADYFNVSLDYLLGRTQYFDNYSLENKELFDKYKQILDLLDSSPELVKLLINIGNTNETIISGLNRFLEIYKAFYHESIEVE